MCREHFETSPLLVHHLRWSLKAFPEPRLMLHEPRLMLHESSGSLEIREITSTNRACAFEIERALFLGNDDAHWRRVSGRFDGA